MLRDGICTSLSVIMMAASKGVLVSQIGDSNFRTAERDVLKQFYKTVEALEHQAPFNISQDFGDKVCD